MIAELLVPSGSWRICHFFQHHHFSLHTSPEFSCCVRPQLGCMDELVRCSRRAWTSEKCHYTLKSHSVTVICFSPGNPPHHVHVEYPLYSAYIILILAFHYATFKTGMSHLKPSFRCEGEIAQHWCKLNNLMHHLTDVNLFYQRKMTGSASIYSPELQPLASIEPLKVKCDLFGNT